MKILIVSRAFYPEISPRANRVNELVKEFTRLGHDVVIYNKKKHADHAVFTNQYGCTIKYYGKKVLPNILIKKYIFFYAVTRAINKLLNILFYYPYFEDALKIPRAIKNEKEYDLLISVAFPHSVHWGVAKAITKNKNIARTWVADCGDPFMGNNLEFRRFFYFKYIERWWLRKVNYISVPLEKAKNAYYPEFREKIVVIPQGFKFEEIKTSFVKNSIPTFLYAGLFIPGSRDPRQFMQYLLQSERNFKFIIHTRQIDFIKPLADDSKGRIEIYDYIPRDELLKKICEMDFVVNFDNNVNEMLPSKLIDYSLANKPILNIKNQMDRNIINQFLEGNYENKLEIKNIEQFNIETVAEKFLELCNNEP